MEKLHKGEAEIVTMALMEEEERHPSMEVYL